MTRIDQGRFASLRSELVRAQQVERHVHFADPAEPARHTADSPLCLPSIHRGQRQGLAETPGRDARLVERLGVARKRARKA